MSQGDLCSIIYFQPLNSSASTLYWPVEKSTYFCDHLRLKIFWTGETAAWKFPDPRVFRPKNMAGLQGILTWLGSFFLPLLVIGVNSLLSMYLIGVWHAMECWSGSAKFGISLLMLWKYPVALEKWWLMVQVTLRNIFASTNFKDMWAAFELHVVMIGFWLLEAQKGPVETSVCSSSLAVFNGSESLAKNEPTSGAFWSNSLVKVGNCGNKNDGNNHVTRLRLCCSWLLLMCFGWCCCSCCTHMRLAANVALWFFLGERTCEGLNKNKSKSSSLASLLEPLKQGQEHVRLHPAKVQKELAPHFEVMGELMWYSLLILLFGTVNKSIRPNHVIIQFLLMFIWS